MTASARSHPSVQSRGSVSSVLRAVHQIWIHETTTYLQPLVGEAVSFWERWTAVRSMADSFDRQFTRERALLDQLREFLPVGVADRLTQDAERIGQLQQALDRTGRQQGTAHTVSVISRSLLGVLGAWCADLESATRRVPREVLPDAAKDVIEDLEFYLLMKQG